MNLVFPLVPFAYSMRDTIARNNTNVWTADLFETAYCLDRQDLMPAGSVRQGNNNIGPVPWFTLVPN